MTGSSPRRAGASHSQDGEPPLAPGGEPATTVAGGEPAEAAHGDAQVRSSERAPQAAPDQGSGMWSGLGFVPTCLAVAAAIAAVAVPIGWWVRGADGAAGAAAGVGVMALAYLISAVIIVWVDAVDRRLLFPIVMLTYVLKIVALGVVGYAARSAEWPGLTAMAVSAGVVIILWPLAQLWWTLRSGRATSEYVRSQSGGAPRSPSSIA